MIIRDIEKLFYHDNIYILALVEGQNDGEYITKYYQDHFTSEDWNRPVKCLDVRDETINPDEPTIIIYCYVED